MRPTTGQINIYSSSAAPLSEVIVALLMFFTSISICQFLSSRFSSPLTSMRSNWLIDSPPHVPPSILTTISPDESRNKYLSLPRPKMIFPLSATWELWGNVWTWAAGMIKICSVVNPCCNVVKNITKQQGKNIPRRMMLCNIKSWTKSPF